MSDILGFCWYGDPVGISTGFSVGMGRVWDRNVIPTAALVITEAACGVVYKCDPLFSRFSRTPTCDRQTDRHKQTDTGPWLVPRMHSIAR